MPSRAMPRSKRPAMCRPTCSKTERIRRSHALLAQATDSCFEERAWMADGDHLQDATGDHAGDSHATPPALAASLGIVSAWFVRRRRSKTSSTNPLRPQPFREALPIQEPDARDKVAGVTVQPAATTLSPSPRLSFGEIKRDAGCHAHGSARACLQPQPAAARTRIPEPHRLPRSIFASGPRSRKWLTSVPNPAESAFLNRLPFLNVNVILYCGGRSVRRSLSGRLRVLHTGPKRCRRTSCRCRPSRR